MFGFLLAGNIEFTELKKKIRKNNNNEKKKINLLRIYR